MRGEDPTFKDTIERINVDDITFDEFIEKYEKGSRPVIIKGVVSQWQAKTKWQIKVSIKLLPYTPPSGIYHIFFMHHNI